MGVVIVSGTRGASSEDCYWLLSQTLGELWPISKIRHGACKNSPDELASRYCHEREIAEEARPADWKRYGKAAGAIRNEDMASAGANWLVALWDGHSRGTSDMIRRAVQHGIETIIIPVQIAGKPLGHGGSTEKEGFEPSISEFRSTIPNADIFGRNARFDELARGVDGDVGAADLGSRRQYPGQNSHRGVA